MRRIVVPDPFKANRALDAIATRRVTCCEIDAVDASQLAILTDALRLILECIGSFCGALGSWVSPTEGGVHRNSPHTKQPFRKRNNRFLLLSHHLHCR